MYSLGVPVYAENGGKLGFERNQYEKGVANLWFWERCGLVRRAIAHKVRQQQIENVCRSQSAYRLADLVQLSRPQ